MNNMDYNVANACHNFYLHTNSFFTNFLKFVTSMGNYGLIFILISSFLLIFKNTRLRAIYVFIALLTTLLFSLIIKELAGRNRPFVDTNSDYYKWWIDTGKLYAFGYSFPSGHTSAAMAFGFSLFLTGNKKTSWLYLLIPFIFGFSRIYFMVHYFTDVVFGAILGLLMSVISNFGFNFIKNKYILKKNN